MVATVQRLNVIKKQIQLQYVLILIALISTVCTADFTGSWIGFDEVYRGTNWTGHVTPAPRYLRKEFTLAEKIQKAELKVASLGWYVLYLNGRRVGNDYFTSGWTDYAKRVYYNTYDVTDMVSQGLNAAGAIIADGWYAGHIGHLGVRDNYGTDIRVKAALIVKYENGVVDTVVTNDSWRASIGPIVNADILHGEIYDARAEMPGWNKVGFDETAWNDVALTESVTALIEPNPIKPVGVFQEITPLSVSEPTPGTFVFDLGTNFSGFARLKATCDEGSMITVSYGERLLEDGTILRANLRSARAQDRYICKGDGVEEWHPLFTYHGFQYVSITGYPGTPTPEAITGIELTSELNVTGRFECSDERLNQLYRNITQSQRANFMSVPTDCPQRDERLGWTGDAQVFIRTACYNSDVQAFFHKWLVDLTDAQLPDGGFPKVAPAKGAAGSGGPGWADAGIIIPWTLYEVYGDTGILKQQYESMKRFMDYRETKMDDAFRPWDFQSFGDWLNILADTPSEVIFTAYTAGDAKIMAQVAALLGNTNDEARFNTLYDDLKTAFNVLYVDESGVIYGNTQTCYILALWFDLVEGEMKQQAEERLITDIYTQGGHLSTGFIGTRDLMNVLSKIGHVDVAYELLFTDTYPSWLFEVKNGATSIWERWDAWTSENGFHNASMNSFNHYANGAVGQWMFENIGGIKSAAPGYQKILIEPHIPDELDWAKVSYNSIQGIIAVEWRRVNDAIEFDIEIPSGTTAEIRIPGKGRATEITPGKYFINADTSYQLTDSLEGLSSSEDELSISFDTQMLSSALSSTDGLSSSQWSAQNGSSSKGVSPIKEYSIDTGVKSSWMLVNSKDPSIKVPEGAVKVSLYSVYGQELYSEIIKHGSFSIPESMAMSTQVIRFMYSLIH
ncbi:MAG: glycoside hydrolase family 78 protein [Fibrobacterales bacterium]